MSKATLDGTTLLEQLRVRKGPFGEAKLCGLAADEIERLREIEEAARVLIVCTEERIDASEAIKTGDLSSAYCALREALYG